MNVLIIGGTGVLSSAVTNEALRQGFKVTMINRGSRSNLIPDNVEFLNEEGGVSEDAFSNMFTGCTSLVEMI